MHYKKSLAINENSNCNKKNKSNRITKKKLKRNIYLRQIGIDNCCGSHICIQFQINANTLHTYATKRHSTMVGRLLAGAQYIY